MDSRPPHSEAEVPERTTPSGRPAVSRKQTILAVDDDPLALRSLRQMLVQKGYQVATAADGTEALDYLGSNVPDLVILDVVLPGVSGYDVCRKMRAAEGRENVPLIFLTAKSRLMDMAEGSDAGGDLYLIKPVPASKLINMVDMFLSKDGPLARRYRKVEV